MNRPFYQPSYNLDSSLPHRSTWVSVVMFSNYFVSALYNCVYLRYLYWVVLFRRLSQLSTQRHYTKTQLKSRILVRIRKYWHYFFSKINIVFISVKTNFLFCCQIFASIHTLGLVPGTIFILKYLVELLVLFYPSSLYIQKSKANVLVVFWWLWKQLFNTQK